MLNKDMNHCMPAHRNKFYKSSPVKSKFKANKKCTSVLPTENDENYMDYPENLSANSIEEAGSRQQISTINSKNTRVFIANGHPSNSGVQVVRAAVVLFDRDAV